MASENAMELMAKPRGRPKVTCDDLQRNMIVDAARRRFVERGYGPTKTEDIVSDCKISKQTLYRLFPCKSALFKAVVEAHQQGWLQLPTDDDDTPLNVALMRIFRIDISAQAAREHIELFRLVMAETRNNPELAAILNTHGCEVSRAALAVWLQRQQVLGRIRPCDSLWLAQLLMDMIFGPVIGKQLGDLTWPSRDERRHHIRRCVDFFLNGAASAPPVG
jgi:TetR/AcrR family transcriptional repressor of mexJK operon